MEHKRRFYTTRIVAGQFLERPGATKRLYSKCCNLQYDAAYITRVLSCIHTGGKSSDFVSQSVYITNTNLNFSVCSPGQHSDLVFKFLRPFP